MEESRPTLKKVKKIGRASTKLDNRQSVKITQEEKLKTEEEEKQDYIWNRADQARMTMPLRRSNNSIVN